MKFPTDNYRKIGDVSYEFWVSELNRVDSPLRAWSREMYDVLRGHTALALAHMWRECQYETDRLVMSADDHNPFNMKKWSGDPTPPEGVTGTVPTGLPGDAPYLTFDSPVSAAKEWRKRVIDDPSYKDGVYTKVSSLSDYIETYAPAADFHAITGVNNSSYYRDMVAILTRFLGGNDMAKNKVEVILIAGHNAVGDGGNGVERGLTPKLAQAYLAAFKAAGIPVSWINPNMYPGGLDGLALATARAIRDADAEIVVALDLHFNGTKSGVHTIVPHIRKSNGAMLSTAYTQGRVPADTAENNTLDVKYASALSKNIVAMNPGMYLWDADGVMLETQTGVALSYSARLAMMAASAPYREKAIRLTVEHGGTNDASRPDFFNRCAAAAVATTKSVLASYFETGSPDPVPTPDPPTGDPGAPSLVAFLFGSADGYAYDPNGPVSKLWLAHGNEVKRWPRLVDVLVSGQEKHFVFGDGTVIRAAGTASPAYVSNVAGVEA